MATIESRVEAMLEQMTLTEKIGQMTQVEKNSISPDEVADCAIGSVLSGGGGNPETNTPEEWAKMVRAFQEGALRSRLAIPLLYGVDAVHGHSNVRGATIFPHNIGLGAARSTELVEQIALATAREMLATNVHWTFAPSVCVPQDIRWGRTYEGFSEDTELVATLGAAHVRGLQRAERPVLPSVKHFVGDGGTAWDSTSGYDWIPGWWVSDDEQRWKIDQGVTMGNEVALRAIHLPPYIAAMAAGARNIMVSYSSWEGLKMHEHRPLLTDLLKGELGFDGFLISDWLGVTQLDADFGAAIIRSINAGMDMVMVPMAYQAFIAELTHAVEQGRVPLSRIDDAVRRILRVKMELGLFEHPFGCPEFLPEVGGVAHRELAREAVRRSLVLLQNREGTLPLPSMLPSIVVAGEAAASIGHQCGGWTIEWQGATGDITPGTTLLAAIQSVLSEGSVSYAADGDFSTDERAPVGLVVLSEPPYTEGEGDRIDLTLSAEEIALVRRVREQCERLVVVLYSGRPLIINEVLAEADAVVAAWLPGTEGQGIADLLFGDFPFTGTLPYAWPRTMAQVRDEDRNPPLFPFGYSLQSAALHQSTSPSSTVFSLS